MFAWWSVCRSEIAYNETVPSATCTGATMGEVRANETQQTGFFEISVINFTGVVLSVATAEAADLWRIGALRIRRAKCTYGRTRKVSPRVGQLKAGHRGRGQTWQYRTACHLSTQPCCHLRARLKPIENLVKHHCSSVAEWRAGCCTDATLALIQLKRGPAGTELAQTIIIRAKICVATFKASRQAAERK